jgi:hypothetical protein
MRARLIELLRSEQGIALPMAMIITVIAMGLAAVPIVASVSSQSGGTNNQRGNEALAAAEAGAEIAVLRQRQLAGEESPRPCLSESPVGAFWCPSVPALSEPPEPIGSAGYRYQVRPCYADLTGSSECADAADRAECTEEEGGAVQIVSTGFSNDVSKRVELTACANTEGGETQEEIDLKIEEVEKETIERIMREEEENGTHVVEEPGEPTPGEKILAPPPNVYAKGQIVGIDSLNMHNDAQIYNGGAGSNGWVKMVGSANVCGTVGYGTTFSTDNSSSNKAPAGCSVGRTVGQGTADYPAVDLPAGIAGANSNSRLAGADPVGQYVWQRGNISWNASNRHLTVSYDQITLEGTQPYFLCRLTLAGGSKLLAGSGKSIRIFFDAPENCPGLNGAAQLQIANGAFVGADASSGPGFYFVGSGNPEASKVELGGGANVSQFVVYAPYSKIVANNGVNLRGVIIGRTLDLGGGADINPGGPFTPPPPSDYIEPEWKDGEPTPGEPIVKASESWTKHSEELVKVIEKIKVLEEEIELNPGAPGTTTVEKSLFVECSAEPDSGDPQPDSGC